jgi:hypothetical protein
MPVIQITQTVLPAFAALPTPAAGSVKADPSPGSNTALRISFPTLDPTVYGPTTADVRFKVNGTATWSAWGMLASVRDAGGGRGYDDLTGLAADTLYDLEFAYGRG